MGIYGNAFNRIISEGQVNPITEVSHFLIGKNKPVKFHSNQRRSPFDNVLIWHGMTHITFRLNTR